MALIQWYPGHMAKAKREVQEQIKKVDVVVEVRDARLPDSSKNPMIDAIIGDKARFIVLNKADLADPRQSQAWVEKLTGSQVQAYALDAKNPRDIKKVRKVLTDFTQPLRQKWADKGVKHKPIRLMVVGIPNVGKSTFINQFTGKKRADVGNKPGVTKGQQWLKIDDDFELLDTPGILWPKFEDQDRAQALALSGAIKDTHYYDDDIALFALEFMGRYYPDYLVDKLALTPDEAHPPYAEVLMIITARQGFKDDYERAANKLILDFRAGRLGRMTLDRVEDCYEVSDVQVGVNDNE
ncbi:ribosome biogenesis GTPase YlqF [Aerococcus urinaehominis]|uniref:Ribosome biogenesis GTPase A n=1 Tax=Aerococcus urinaehominis TaxID=128944 RepID=A0A109RHJ7_9LACT|nr:ribosome biogenesis GTPase YlqF [Aerococcus urinaehominis]AMB98695.1 ribosome biogenesis GTPase YlqF [Aerococcus urinaehominis]SDL98971.1 ribosome biogenesis GTPase A [Aerococcus urinaehominis]